MRPTSKIGARLLGGMAFAVWAGAAIAQSPAAVDAEQNHRNMMDQLGIRTLRPGPSGDEAAPNHANYDEALANPYPDLPDPLLTRTGGRVTSSVQWRTIRRPELLAALEHEIYGKAPSAPPKVTWTVVASEHEQLGFPGVSVLVRQMVGHVDNATDPAISVDIRMTVVTPDKGRGPAPLLIMFARDGFPAPTSPSRQEVERIDAALKASAVAQDGSLRAVFAAHPGFTLASEAPFHLPQKNADGDPMPPEQLAAAGWAFALLDPTSIQADNGAGLTRGIIGLVNKGQPRRPDDWGALRAWQWGASRAFDQLAADPAIDPKAIGVEGVSRYGKAALVTMAFDQRFAMALVGSSGKGGATPLRRNWGEDISNLATGEDYWFAGRLLTYDAAQATFGRRTPGDLTVDSNALIALCAPRLTFISYGVPEQGDAKWLDHRGSWMATVSASEVWDLLGAKGLNVARDYHAAPMPAVNQGLLDGQLAWRQHDGGHTDAPNMKWFIQWVDRQVGHSPPQAY